MNKLKILNFGVEMNFGQREYKTNISCFEYKTNKLNVFLGPVLELKAYDLKFLFELLFFFFDKFGLLKLP
jgi:hypothetical protein